jgi:hypothetical protein
MRRSKNPVNNEAPHDRRVGAQYAHRPAVAQGLERQPELPLPEGFDTQDLQSIVIWWEPVQQAYTAATLRRE